MLGGSLRVAMEPFDIEDDLRAFCDATGLTREEVAHLATYFFFTRGIGGVTFADRHLTIARAAGDYARAHRPKLNPAAFPFDPDTPAYR